MIEVFMSENMTDLEWLARRVHKWTPDDPNHKLRLHKADALNAKGWTFAHCYSCGYSFDEWQAERARLQNKPSWDDAPEWAQWLAQDDDGSWVFYESPLDFDEDLPEWVEKEGFDGHVSFVASGEVLGDWRDTLERRPERSLYEITTSNGDKYMFTDATEPKIEWRGPEDGLPPVGTKCEIAMSHTAYSEDAGSIIDIPIGTEVEVNGTANFGLGDVIVFSGRVGGDWFYSTHKYEKLFRPLRTEEDRAVEDMVSVMDKIACCDLAIHPKIAEALYKAGYRKQEPSE